MTDNVAPLRHPDDGHEWLESGPIDDGWRECLVCGRREHVTRRWSR